MKYPIIHLDLDGQIKLLARLYDHGYSFMGRSLSEAIQIWQKSEVNPYMYVTDIGAIWTLGASMYYNLQQDGSLNHILVNSPAHFLTLVRRLAHKA